MFYCGRDVLHAEDIPRFAIHPVHIWHRQLLGDRRRRVEDGQSLARLLHLRNGQQSLFDHPNTTGIVPILYSILSVLARFCGPGVLQALVQYD